MDDSIRTRWIAALQQAQPLPTPVATAMVETAARGAVGTTLLTIEAALAQLDAAALDNITGSEARVLIAVLGETGNHLAQLRERIAQLW